jgi:hypothetical protein
MTPACPTPTPASAFDPALVPDSERGYVTAETALLLPILLGIGYALALVVLLAADQIRCGDAAWEAARALHEACQLPNCLTLPHATPRPEHTRRPGVTDGSLTVEVDRDQSVASRFLPSIRISATATVPCEPHVDGCQTESQTTSPGGRMADPPSRATLGRATGQPSRALSTVASRSGHACCRTCTP